MADFDMDKLKDLGALGAEAAKVAGNVKELGQNIMEKSKELFGKADGDAKEGAADLKKDAEAFIDKAKDALEANKKDLERFEKDAKAALKDDKKAVKEFVDKVDHH
ncbi:MAG: hypothetical protein HDQ87_01635 [Clostridia bacterium]|nr:hypothetical protein [Clostridia bacterium]